MDEVAYRPASELVRALVARELSSRELLELYLERVDRSQLNAVVTLDPEGARGPHRPPTMPSREGVPQGACTGCR